VPQDVRGAVGGARAGCAHVFFVHSLAHVGEFRARQALVAVAVHDAKQQKRPQNFGEVVSGANAQATAQR